MATIRVSKNKDNPYVMINKVAIEDTNLSWKAKGIFAYLMSKPDDWKCQKEDLVKNSSDGEASVRSGLRELRKYGYLIKRSIKNEKNVIVEWEEILFEVPQEEAKEIFRQQEEKRIESLEKRHAKKEKEKEKATSGKSTTGENDEKSSSRKPTCGNSTCGKPPFIINNNILNTDIPTNEISCSSREEQIDDIFNLYLEQFKTMPKSRKIKLIDYFNKTNYEFMKAVLLYVIDYGANKPKYLDIVIDSALANNITTAEEFYESVKKHYENIGAVSKVKINKKGNEKKIRFNDFKQREYDYDSLEKKLLGWDKPEEGDTVENFIGLDDLFNSIVGDEK